jgi:hypothetical protein
MLPLGATQAAELVLQFGEPADFTDIRAPGDQKQDEYQKRVFVAIAEALTPLAAEMPEQQRLAIEISDIDLAGQLKHRPGMALPGVRVDTADGRYPARISLSYRLVDQSEQVLAEGSDELVGNRMPGSVARPSRNRPEFEHEQKLLEQWFKKTF